MCCKARLHSTSVQPFTLCVSPIHASPFTPTIVQYSEKYEDLSYEYRHVILPKDLAKELPKRTLSEPEWRGIGVIQSRGWVHYAVHGPEPHILLFRRPLGTDPTTGRVDPVRVGVYTGCWCRSGAHTTLCYSEVGT
jgi:cyclin-dependent kinase regulatory subunit CKS1